MKPIDRPSLHPALILSLVLTMILAAHVQAGEKIPIDQLPRDILDEVKTTQPGSKIISAEKLSDHAYDVEIQQNGKTSHVSIGGGIPGRTKGDANH